MSDAPANIVLTGFMGSGKSTIGRMLADRLDATFVDTDVLIEDRWGPIPQIFAEQGEDAFRAYEREVAIELAGRRGLVVATGGRMMLDQGNADALGATGRILCLRVTPETVIVRIGSSAHTRPLLADDPERRVRELLAERSRSYDRFEQVDTDGRAPSEVVDEIVARITAG